MGILQIIDNSKVRLIHYFNIEWLYFCVFKFSRNAKDFTPFFAKFRENCESKKKRHSTGNVLYVHENGFNFDLIQSVKKQRLSMYGFVTNI